jgi:hypothetical protein
VQEGAPKKELAPAFVMPAHILQNMHAAAEQSTIGGGGNGGSPVPSFPHPPPKLDYDEPIDPALISAMENSKERLGVFGTEQKILDFVKSRCG